MMATRKREAIKWHGHDLLECDQSSQGRWQHQDKNLYAKIEQLAAERNFFEGAGVMRVAHCLHMIEGEHTHLLVTEYCPLVSISHLSFYYAPVPAATKSFS